MKWNQSKRAVWIYSGMRFCEDVFAVGPSAVEASWWGMRLTSPYHSSKVSFWFQSIRPTMHDALAGGHHGSGQPVNFTVAKIRGRTILTLWNSLTIVSCNNTEEFKCEMPIRLSIISTRIVSWLRSRAANFQSGRSIEMVHKRARAPPIFRYYIPNLSKSWVDDCQNRSDNQDAKYEWRGRTA